MYNYYHLSFFILFLGNILAVELDFSHGGWQREAYLYKPSCIPENIPDDFEPVPLVFMIHGLGGVGADNYNFSSVAEDSCFMVVFPSGLFNTWNTGPNMNYSHEVDDNSYFDALIDTINSKFPLDTNRIYLTGHSMGGFMASHMNCTSTNFTAYAGSGGGVYSGYFPNNAYHELCSIENGAYPNPMIISHGIGDATVPYEHAIFNLYNFLLLNRCNGSTNWPYDYSWPSFNEIGVYWDDPEDDFDDITDIVYSNADTLEHNGLVQRYQWSDGCLGGSPALEAIMLPSEGHAWHQTWNSAINTPLEHWNFLKQFSKDKMGPVLDSLALPLSVTLDDEYYVNGESTSIGILAIDNYAVASMTISFSGFINVEGFDLTLDFDTNERLFYGDYDAVLDPTITTDNYETTGISIVDHDGNEKVYDFEMLQDLGLHQQMAVLNNVSTSSTKQDLTLPKTYALHQNYPNPFNPETKIGYDLADESMVSLKVYDMKGTLVKTLLNENQSSGHKTIKWDGTSDLGQKVSAGLYLYRIQTESFASTKKMALLK
ncbi:MAG: FlgD immunoglobulin-like domain containing protein [Candidatus Neomarinimicrobiota bacterium]